MMGGGFCMGGFCMGGFGMGFMDVEDDLRLEDAIRVR
jgi:hypothetical protein